MSGNAYPRAPPQGYTSAGYTQYQTAYQYGSQPQYQYGPQPQYPQVTPSTGYVVAGPQTTVTGAPPYAEAPPPYTEHAQNPQVPVQQNVCFENGFDFRARFDGSAQPRIPPPPPGVVPNAAQLAAMQGHNVTATQEHRDVTWSFD